MGQKEIGVCLEVLVQVFIALVVRLPIVILTRTSLSILGKRIGVCTSTELVADCHIYQHQCDSVDSGKSELTQTVFARVKGVSEMVFLVSACRRPILVVPVVRIVILVGFIFLVFIIFSDSWFRNR